MVDMHNIVEFNYTEAIPGGAWLKDLNGNVEWVCYSEIVRVKGEEWYQKNRRKQGWMTGCWIPAFN